MFFDPADGTCRKKMVGGSDDLPKFARTFWTDPGRLFLFGGRIGDTVVNNCLEFNGSTKKFEKRKDMNEPRSDSTVVYVPYLDRIYVLGGNDMRKFYKECEYYEPALDKWTAIAPMAEGRDSGAACLFNGLYIYAFSGRNKFKPKEIIDIIEKYDINTNKWETVQVKSQGPWIKNDLSLAWQFGSS